jgi:toxin ParE1/3/4
MRKVLKRPLAQKDIKGIWKHTFKEWGESQASYYLKSLEEQFFALAELPQLGSTVVHQQMGLRQYRYKKHLIIYQYSDASIDIVRVLHQRMDITQHNLS